ncbi:TB2/DP1, HVA22 family-domain-containing protein [Mucor mucedo]|uniref:TB2/DP1, HVA22 family-domain-containing protein n=1 Tax=Mucor mucedo TaxID=29922 RepID=UPI00221E3B23|nr:TB2/DP1, HVA22 family-domain-containing protein [Mucor mucedo]KAI7888509.1 TB2/DP1, HVA22 family-domain-containing protein [Mucor mucedo]
MLQSLICEEAPKPQHDTTLWTQFISSVQETCKHQLEQYQVTDQLAKLSKPPVAIGTFLALMVFLQFGGHILTNVISWAYPAYASFLAIESPSTDDDTQWLIYWTVIGFVRLGIYFLDIFLSWSSVYYTCKTLVILWLVLPQFKGAETVYAYVLRPYLLKAEPEIESSIKNISDKFSFSLFSRGKIIMGK